MKLYMIRALDFMGLPKVALSAAICEPRVSKKAS